MIELYETDFDDINQFTLLWRWSKERNTELLPQELNLIRLFKSEGAKKLHDRLLPVYQHERLIALRSRYSAKFRSMMSMKMQFKNGLKTYP